MRQDLLALQRKLGITTIFVTHDQEEAMTTADRMAVLDAGIVQQVGTPTDLFDNPINRFVAEFVGTTNFLPGRFEKTRRAFDVPGLGAIPLDRDASAISVRPHTLALVAAGKATGGDHVWFDGEVVAREFLGEFTRYGVRAGTTHLTADAPHLASEPLLAVGAKVRIGINPIEVRALPA
jgi:iron(III) transport system ATP-binding protein